MVEEPGNELSNIQMHQKEEPLVAYRCYRLIIHLLSPSDRMSRSVEDIKKSLEKTSSKAVVGPA
jgi:hypothetical protein